MIVLLIYGLVSMSLMFLGAKELIVIKLLRLGIAIVMYVSCYFTNMRFRYATTIISTLWLSLTGAVNIIALSKTGGNVTFTGWAGELIGSENTMGVFILIMTIQNNANVSVMILSPLYLLINALMLRTVIKDIEGET